MAELFVKLADISVCEQEQAAEDLRQKDDDVEVGSENSSDELSRDALILRTRDEVQKAI
jgi:hypothetical protein